MSGVCEEGPSTEDKGGPGLPQVYAYGIMCLCVYPGTKWLASPIIPGEVTKQVRECFLQSLGPTYSMLGNHSQGGVGGGFQSCLVWDCWESQNKEDPL